MGRGEDVEQHGRDSPGLRRPRAGGEDGGARPAKEGMSSGRRLHGSGDRRGRSTARGAGVAHLEAAGGVRARLGLGRAALGWPTLGRDAGAHDDGGTWRSGTLVSERFRAGELGMFCRHFVLEDSALGISGRFHAKILRPPQTAELVESTPIPIPCPNSHV